MFGCLGYGVTVCDRSRMANGDYKHVAHIADYGGIQYYDASLTEEARQRINQHALHVAQTFRNHFMRMPHREQYSMYFIYLPHEQACAAKYDPNVSSARLYDMFIDAACRNMKREMPAYTLDDLANAIEGGVNHE